MGNVAAVGGSKGYNPTAAALPEVDAESGVSASTSHGLMEATHGTMVNVVVNVHTEGPPASQPVQTDVEKKQVEKEVKQRVKQLEERMHALDLDNDDNENYIGARFTAMQSMLGLSSTAPALKEERLSTSRDGGSAVKVAVQSMPGAPTLRKEKLSTSRDEGSAMEGQEGHRQPSDSRPLEEPWRSYLFREAWTGSSDIWQIGMVKDGWLVRQHVKLRKLKFTPLHSTLQVQPHHLDFQRVTLQFFEDGAKKLMHDDWRNTTRVSSSTDRLWRGYTFFKVTSDCQSEAETREGGQQEDPVSDGSFERI